MRCRVGLRCGAVAVALAAGTSVSAKLTVEPAIEGTLAAGYSRSPFLSPTDTSASAFTQVEVAPELRFRDERTDAVLRGRYNRTDYLTRYGNNDGYGVSVQGTTAFTPLISLDLSASFDSSVLGALDSRVGRVRPVPQVVDPAQVAPQNPVVALDPLLLDPLLAAPTVDVGVLGLRQRRNLLTAAATLNRQLSDRSNWTFGIDATRASFPGSGLALSSFRAFGGRVGYSRALNERARIGVDVRAERVSYDVGTRTTSFTPQLTYRTLLSSRWSLNAGVGVAIVRQEGRTTVSPSGNASLCETLERGQLCFNASRSPAATGLGTVRNQTTLGLDYAYRLDEKTDLGASLGYSRLPAGESRGSSAITTGTRSYITAEGRIGRSLNRSLRLFAAGGYRDISGGGLATRADLYARVGLNVRFEQK